MEITLLHLLRALAHAKGIFLLALCISFILTLTTLFMDDRYASVITIAPIDASQSQESGLLSAASQFGLDIGENSASGSLYKEARHIIDSRAFLYKFIPQNNLYEELILEDAYRKFLRQNLKMSFNRQNNFLEVSVMSRDPSQSQIIVNNLVNSLQEYMKQKDAIDAQKNIDGVIEEIENINNAELKSAFRKYLEIQASKLLSAKHNVDYAFKIVETSILPQKKSYPPRAVIGVILTFLLFFVVLLIILMNLYIFSSYSRLRRKSSFPYFSISKEKIFL